MPNRPGRLLKVNRNYRNSGSAGRAQIPARGL